MRIKTIAHCAGKPGASIADLVHAPFGRCQAGGQTATCPPRPTLVLMVTLDCRTVGLRKDRRFFVSRVCLRPRAVKLDPQTGSSGASRKAAATPPCGHAFERCSRVVAAAPEVLIRRTLSDARRRTLSDRSRRDRHRPEASRSCCKRGKRSLAQRPPCPKPSAADFIRWRLRPRSRTGPPLDLSRYGVEACECQRNCRDCSRTGSHESRIGWPSN